jgi:quercetin dioxygenase-like cupin family protein
MDIKRNGTQPSAKGPIEWFTGSVRIDSSFQRSSSPQVGGAIVTFEPAPARRGTHPLGQTLIVTAGSGRAQREGGGSRRSVRVTWSGSRQMRSTGTGHRRRRR